jgi:hypothetical protein
MASFAHPDEGRHAWATLATKPALVLILGAGTQIQTHRLADRTDVPYIKKTEDTFYRGPVGGQTAPVTIYGNIGKGQSNPYF